MPSRAAITPWLLTLRPEQRDIAAVRAVIVPWLTHRSGAGAGELVAAGHEVRVGDVQRRGDEPADIDLRALAEQHAIGIDQEDLAVGDRLPRITDGSAPSTRLSATDCALGWTNWTVSPAPMLKLCQLITTFAVVWWMVVYWFVLEIVASPRVTTPPSGWPAWATVASDTRMAPASVLMAKRLALASPAGRRWPVRANTKCRVGLAMNVHGVILENVRQPDWAGQRYLIAWIQNRPPLSGAEIASSPPSLLA